MRLGKCPGCGGRIGAYTANGVFRYVPHAIMVVDVIYAYPERPETTAVTVVVCTDCGSSGNYEKIILGLHDDTPFQMFRQSAPDAYPVRMQTQQIPGAA